jgi:hypothetical protein
MDAEQAHRSQRFSTGVEIGQRLSFTADAIDPRIEAIQHDDWKAASPLAALKLSVAVVGRRAVHEVAMLRTATSTTTSVRLPIRCQQATST